MKCHQATSLDRKIMKSFSLGIVFSTGFCMWGCTIFPSISTSGLSGVSGPSHLCVAMQNSAVIAHSLKWGCWSTAN